MNIVRTVVVFDAADLEGESTFWAGVLNGWVARDDDWHSVIDAEGLWRIGVQLAPNHVAPDWPGETVAQQVHLDLHVDDPGEAHAHVMALGARLLQGVENFEAEDGFQVYADPAGHPFCIGWGQPTALGLKQIVARRRGIDVAG